MPADETVWVALGSNLGDSPGIVRRALDRLQTLSASPVLRSSLWRSAPVDCPPGSPAFVNAAAAFHPPADETPLALLRRLQAMEVDFGRQSKKFPNEPRLLDVDLIAFGTRMLDLPELVLPHPRAHLRPFVLAPLAEIAPELVLPGQRRTVAQLWRDLPPDHSLVRLNP
jgi:2-amino-4-hydroxy-6-hydroxymethyldihydropteridine diphosphokinase